MRIEGSRMRLALSALAAAFLFGAARAEPTSMSAAEQNEMVAAHNHWREKVGVPDLAWSPDLAKTAQDWAEHLNQTRSCAMQHSERGDTGQNLAWYSPLRYSTGKTELQQVTSTQVTGDWGSEQNDYDHASNRCSKVCGHYTQLVWESTTKVGCGRAICADSSQVWVCDYSPPGNFVGQKPY